MIDQVTASHLIAMLVGIVIGIGIALPWRPIIKRRVMTRNIDELTRQLHEAIDELDRIEQREHNDPFIGNLGAFA